MKASKLIITMRISMKIMMIKVHKKKNKIMKNWPQDYKDHKEFDQRIQNIMKNNVNFCDEFGVWNIYDIFLVQL